MIPSGKELQFYENNYVNMSIAYQAIELGKVGNSTSISFWEDLSQCRYAVGEVTTQWRLDDGPIP